MEKTYRLLEHAEPLSEAEIVRLYDGYWVYLVKAKMTETMRVIEGIPVVIGAVPYDGVEDGIYDKYMTDEYENRVGMSLRHNRGFISCLRIVREGANG